MSEAMTESSVILWGPTRKRIGLSRHVRSVELSLDGIRNSWSLTVEFIAPPSGVGQVAAHIGSEVCFVLRPYRRRRTSAENPIYSGRGKVERFDPETWRLVVEGLGMATRSTR